MKRMKLTFERGGSLTVIFSEDAPKTVASVLEALPIENDLIQSRYCGQEIFFGFGSKNFPPPENQTSHVKKFDVAYWRNWDSPNAGLPGSPGAEVLSVYYGDDYLQFKGEPLIANIIGHVDKSEESMLDEIGMRIWQKGFEKVRATLLEDDE